jgi:hypothetical protein
VRKTESSGGCSTIPCRFRLAIDREHLALHPLEHWLGSLLEPRKLLIIHQLAPALDDEDPHCAVSAVADAGRFLRAAVAGSLFQ